MSALAYAAPVVWEAPMSEQCRDLVLRAAIATAIPVRITYTSDIVPGIALTRRHRGIVRGVVSGTVRFIAGRDVAVARVVRIESGVGR